MIGLLMDACLTHCPGVAAGHIHAPEIRTVDTIDEFMDVVKARYVRVAVDSEEHGAVLVYRADDGTFGCQFVVLGECKDEKVGLDEAAARAWLRLNHPLIFGSATSH